MTEQDFTDSQKRLLDEVYGPAIEQDETFEAMIKMLREVRLAGGSRLFPMPPSRQDKADYREAKRPKKQKARGRVWKRRK